MSLRRPGITTLTGDEPRLDEKQLYLAAIASFGLLGGSDPETVTRRASGRLGLQRPSERLVRAFSWERLFERVDSPRLRSRLISDLVRAHSAGVPWSPRELALLKRISAAWSVGLPALAGVAWDQVPDAAPAAAQKKKQPGALTASFLRYGLATEAALACIAIGLLIGWLG